MEEAMSDSKQIKLTVSKSVYDLVCTGVGTVSNVVSNLISSSVMPPSAKVSKRDKSEGKKSLAIRISLGAAGALSQLSKEYDLSKSDVVSNLIRYEYDKDNMEDLSGKVKPDKVHMGDVGNGPIHIRMSTIRVTNIPSSSLERLKLHAKHQRISLGELLGRLGDKLPPLPMECTEVRPMTPVASYIWGGKMIWVTNVSDHNIVWDAFQYCIKADGGDGQVINSRREDLIDLQHIALTEQEAININTAHANRHVVTPKSPRILSESPQTKLKQWSEDELNALGKGDDFPEHLMDAPDGCGISDEYLDYCARTDEKEPIEPPEADDEPVKVDTAVLVQQAHEADVSDEPFIQPPDEAKHTEQPSASDTNAESPPHDDELSHHAHQTQMPNESDIVIINGKQYDMSLYPEGTSRNMVHLYPAPIDCMPSESELATAKIHQEHHPKSWEVD